MAAVEESLVQVALATSGGSHVNLLNHLQMNFGRKFNTVDKSGNLSYLQNKNTCKPYGVFILDPHMAEIGLPEYVSLAEQIESGNYLVYFVIDLLGQTSSEKIETEEWFLGIHF